MSLTPEQRSTIIDHLIANCDCWKAQGDREVLNDFSDEKLKHLKALADKEAQAIVVANAAVNGFTDGGMAYRVNPETGNWEKRAVANKHKGDGEEDEENYEGDDEGEEEDEDEELDFGKKKKKVENKRRTLSEIAEQLGPEEQDYLNVLANLEQREKGKIIEQLLVNLNPSERGTHREHLLTRPLGELEYMLNFAPRAAGDERAGERGMTASTRHRQAPAEEDLLVAPVLNWEEVASGKEAPGKEVAPVFNEEDEEPAFDEVLKHLPPKARRKVQNAEVIVEKEKRRIIAELTDNITDEEHQERMRNRLANKDLDELRDMLLLTPRREEKQTVNYFGSAGAPPFGGSYGGAAQRRNDPNEDVLVPPVINFQEEAGDKKRKQA
jgi:hypothetical protein